MTSQNIPVAERDPKRAFTPTERHAIYVAADGRCEECGEHITLEAMEADHHVPHAAGGKTRAVNGRCLCGPCNQGKRDKVPAPQRRLRLPARPWPETRPLREWQRGGFETAADLIGRGRNSMLVDAVPAAGKTTFGLSVAHKMLEQGDIERVVVVAPTRHICEQWAGAASYVGIELEPNRKNSDGLEVSQGYHGVAVTYGAVAAGPLVHERGCGYRTLVIFDEPHHMAEDRAWGDRATHAFDGAVFHLLLSGTAWRTDGERIPYVNYDEETNFPIADVRYDYAQALADNVCRHICFEMMGGEVEWALGGDLFRHDFREDLSPYLSSLRLRVALDPRQGWIRDVLTRAARHLQEIRATDQPDAGGLVVCTSIQSAKAIASLLRQITGVTPVVAHHDDDDAASLIANFRSSGEPWIVAVKMVSEGVDIPRLRVGVYATTSSTSLFFRQVVGRFVRTIPGEPPDRTSHLYVPSDPALRGLAMSIMQDGAVAAAYDHDRDDSRDSLPDDDREVEGLEPLGARGEPLERILDGRIVDDEEFERLRVAALEGLDGISDAEAAHAAMVQNGMLAKRVSAPEIAPTPIHRQIAEARERRKHLVRALSRATGEGHDEIHRSMKVNGRGVRDQTLDELNAGNLDLERQIAQAQNSRRHVVAPGSVAADIERLSSGQPPVTRPRPATRPPAPRPASALAQNNDPPETQVVEPQPAPNLPAPKRAAADAEARARAQLEARPGASQSTGAVVGEPTNPTAKSKLVEELRRRAAQDSSW